MPKHHGTLAGPFRSAIRWMTFWYYLNLAMFATGVGFFIFGLFDSHIALAMSGGVMTLVFLFGAYECSYSRSKLHQSIAEGHGMTRFICQLGLFFCFLAFTGLLITIAIAVYKRHPKEYIVEAVATGFVALLGLPFYLTSRALAAASKSLTEVSALGFPVDVKI